MKNTFSHSYFVLVLLSSFIVSGCFSNYARLRNKIDIQKQAFSSSTPIHFKYRTLNVDVLINGKTYQMIFDTGAHSTVVSRELANELLLKRKGGIKVGDSRGARNKLDITLIDSLSIGDVSFYDINALVVDWSEESVIKCIAPDGIIGNNLIAKCNWLVDIKNGSIHLSSDSIPADSLHFVEMKYGSNKPHIDLKVNGNLIEDILFDTGSGGGLDISQEDGKEIFGPLQNANAIEIDGTTQGLFGAKLDTVHIFKADSLTIGSLTIPKIALDVEKHTDKIGHKYFQQGKIYLDYTNHKIGLQLPSEEFTEKQNAQMPLIPQLDSAGLYIGSIIIDSEPWNAGLRVGDRIKRSGHFTHDYVITLDPCTYLSERYDNIPGDEGYSIEPEKMDTTITIKAQQL